jgi:hypothetical protein
MKIKKDFAGVKLLSKLALIGVLGLALMPGAVLAEGDDPPDTVPITQLSHIETILTTIANYIFTFFYIIVGIFFIWAALSFLMAGGDAEKVTKAKNMFIYAIIAVTIALLATSVKGFLINLLTP